MIPTGVSLTTYSGGVDDFLAMPLQALLDQVADGTLPVRTARVFGLDDIVEAHRTMESNTAGGKIVGRHPPTIEASASALGAFGRLRRHHSSAVRICVLAT